MLVTAGQIASRRRVAEDAERLLREARSSADAIGDEITSAVADAWLARGPDEARVVAASVDALGERLTVPDTIVVRKRLFDVGAGVEQLRKAHEGLRRMAGLNDARHHTAMLTNVRVHREIVEACRAHGIA